MKSKKFLWIAIVFAGGVLWGCDKNDSSKDDADLPYAKSFIFSYAELPTQAQVEAALVDEPIPHETDPADLEQLRTVSTHTETVYSDVKFVLKTKLGTTQTVYHDLWGSGPFSEEEIEAAAKFTELAKANDDFSYNRKGQGFGVCLYKKTESLHVVSDAAYDAEHPAGTLLDDVLDVMFWSAEDYLKSGYTSFLDYLGKTTRPTYPERSDGAVVAAEGPCMIESLVEFNQLQRTLINFGFIFMPNKAPNQTGTHRFTVTYTNEDGVVLTGTTEPITILGAEK